MRVSYVGARGGVHNKPMRAPKKVEQIEAWLKAARRAIPEIPDWPILKFRVTPELVVFALQQPKGLEVANVVINRKASSLG